jgi:uncharacterized membrane protein/predicted DsbA family dithiol-disulfide isomerase
VRQAVRLVSLRVLALAALTLSSAALVDYFRESPGLCGFGTGCDQVIHSAFGQPLGVPLPALGLAGFGAVFALTLWPDRRAGRWLRPLALAAGAAGATLLTVQVTVLGRVCPLCLGVDSCAVGLAVVELIFAFAGTLPPSPVSSRWPWAAVALLGVAAPGLWAALQEPPFVPPEVKVLWTPGTVTVVDVTDFDCPHCRQTHPALAEVRREQPDGVRFVRVVAPMPLHANSRPAARAYLAAESQGRADEMAEALYAAGDLSADGCRRLAANLDLDLARYDAVVNDPATDARLDATVAWVRPAAPRGLPVLWVQEEQLAGPRSAADLLAALRQAKPYRPSP